MKVQELDKYCFYKPNVEPIKTELKVFSTVYPEKPVKTFNTWINRVKRLNKTTK